MGSTSSTVANNRNAPNPCTRWKRRRCDGAEALSVPPCPCRMQGTLLDPHMLNPQNRKPTDTAWWRWTDNECAHKKPMRRTTSEPPPTCEQFAKMWLNSGGASLLPTSTLRTARVVAHRAPHRKTWGAEASAE